jgi:hypothetical protein
MAGNGSASRVWKGDGLKRPIPQNTGLGFFNFGFWNAEWGLKKSKTEIRTLRDRVFDYCGMGIVECGK